jgi:hypothetical protein
MLRLVELALFLAPIALFVAWRMVLPRGPSRTALFAFVGVLAALAGLLVWLSHDNALPPGTEYVPPHLENGVVVPAHGAPR